MIRTSDLIEALVLDLDTRPVRRLRPPALRAALWLVLTPLIFGLLALAHGMRPDLTQRLQQPDFAIATAASLLTGVLAACTAFMLNLPGRSANWALLPLPTLGAWLATIGQSSMTNWVDVGPDGVQAGEAARCATTVLLTSLPLSIVMISMLRRGTMFRPHALAFTGSLAVAAMTATAMMLFHRLDASAMVLVWNLGTTGLVIALGCIFGRRLLAAVPWGA